jgi:chitinase
MKLRKLLVILGILLVFSAGFSAGIFFGKSAGQKQSSITNEAPLSKKTPKQKEVPGQKEKKRKVLIGYIQDFRDPEMVDYSKLTHVIFSFAHPTKDGAIVLNGEMAMKHLRAHVAKAENTGTKVMLAVGGWYHIYGGESYDYFKTAIANPDSRTRLVNELVRFVEREKLNGVDVDFEHPRSAEDAQNLAVFIKELSEKLHPKQKELSVAVHAKIHSVTLKELYFVQYDPAMFAHVDHVNIMAYDGQWDGDYNAANLSPYPFVEKIVNYWADLFDANHLPKEKLVLGVPSYAQPENPETKPLSYATIVEHDPASAKRDTVEMNGTTYHYNGEETIQKKTRLALDRGFGGMMVWELGQDLQGEYSLTGNIASILMQNT